MALGYPHLMLTDVGSDHCLVVECIGHGADQPKMATWIVEVWHRLWELGLQGCCTRAPGTAGIFTDQRQQLRQRRGDIAGDANMGRFDFVQLGRVDVDVNDLGLRAKGSYFACCTVVKA